MACITPSSLNTMILTSSKSSYFIIRSFLNLYHFLLHIYQFLQPHDCGFCSNNWYILKQRLRLQYGVKDYLAFGELKLIFAIFKVKNILFESDACGMSLIAASCFCQFLLVKCTMGWVTF